MKLTKEQENTLRELAFAELPNSEIAKRIGLPLTEVHAARHRMGITIAKVAAAKGKQPQAVPREPTVGAARQQMTVEPEDIDMVIHKTELLMEQLTEGGELQDELLGYIRVLCKARKVLLGAIADKDKKITQN